MDYIRSRRDISTIVTTSRLDRLKMHFHIRQVFYSCVTLQNYRWTMGALYGMK